MLKKCFGIISGLPDGPDRIQRKARLSRLIKQLNELGPNIDILIIAQNWSIKDKLPKVDNKIIIKKYSPLGILGARKALRAEFLKLDYDYIVTFDDDAIIECSTETAAEDYMKAIDEHPNGFCFIHSRNKSYVFDNYKAAQLNLCAISRYVFEKAPYIDVNPQNNEAFEDHVYAYYLHIKFAACEFMPPETITHTQFLNKKEPVPSTGARQPGLKTTHLVENTNAILRYIKEYKELPNDIHKFIEEYQKSIPEVRVNPVLAPPETSDNILFEKIRTSTQEIHKNNKTNYLYF